MRSRRMMSGEIDQFIFDLERALEEAFGFDACQVRIDGVPPTRRTGFPQQSVVLRLPLVHDNQLVGCVIASREGDELCEQDQDLLSQILSVAVDRLHFMRLGETRQSQVHNFDADETGHSRSEADELQSLLRAQCVVARQDELFDVFTAIVQELQFILNPITVNVYKLDHRRKMLINYLAGIGDHRLLNTSEEIPADVGLLGSALNEGRAMLVNDAHQDHRAAYPSKTDRLIRLFGENVMIAPLTSEGQVSGAIVVNRPGHRRFSVRDFQLFKLFAGRMEAAFDEVRRRDRERAKRESLEALFSFTTRIAGIESEPEFLRCLVEVVQDFTAADCISVMVVDRSGDRALVATNLHDDITTVYEPRDREDQQTAVRNGIHGSVIERPEDLCRELATAVALEESSGALQVPIVGTSGTLGRIWTMTSGDSFDPSIALRHLEVLASIAAVALERIRASDLASEVEETIDVLSRSSHIALDAQVDQDAVGRLVSLISEIVSARAISAWMVDSDQKSDRRSELRMEAFHGPESLRDAYSENPLSDALASSEHRREDAAPVMADVKTLSLPARAVQQYKELGIGAVLALKLSDSERDYGIVRIDFASPDDLPPSRIVRLLRGVVDQFAVGLSAVRMRERWMDLYRSSVEALAATVDAKDPYTHTHSRNVAYYSLSLAERLGLPENQVQQIELAGLLHDIGKISIADRLLTKTEPLDPHERMEMMAHPVRGSQILEGDEGLAELVPIVRHHHERHDGLGYPDGLSGDEIPIGAGIVGIADAVDTMLNDRSYARRRTLDEVRSEVRAAAGTQFVPAVAQAFLELIDESPEMIRVSDDGFDVEPRIAIPDHLPVADVAQVRVISRVAHELSTLTDLPTFVHGAVAIVAEELGYDRVEICLDPVRPDSMSLGTVEDLPCGKVCKRITHQVVEGNRVLNIPDLATLSEFSDGSQTGSTLSVPLRVEGEPIGALCVISERNSAFSIVDEALLTVAANQLAAGLQVAQLHDHVKWTARHDALTQALNHGAFYEELGQAIELHQSTGEPVSLILCDVEGLKRVNDELGHLAGDSILRLLVRRIRDILRSRDLIARYGGDEFAIITFGTTRVEATEITSKLHESLRTEPLLGGDVFTRVTTGIAQVGEDGFSPAELVEIADHRLYEVRGRR